MPTSIDLTETGEVAPIASHLRERRLLLGCLAASLALHALVLAALPVWLVKADAPSVRVLEVALMQPEPLPVTAPQPAAPAPPEEALRREPARPKSAAGRPRPKEAAPFAPEPSIAPPPRAVTLPETTAPPSPAAATASAAAPARTAPVVAPSQASVPPQAAGESGESAPTPPLFNAAYLNNPPPRYPLAARRNGEQGTVTLRVLVNAEGRPAAVSVEKTSGSPHLDNAALDTVRSWRFVPARRGERAVEAWVLVPIVFRLEGAS
jgi:protein TonB